MTDITLLGPWVRRFLLEHLIVERNLSPQTQHSYRDTLRLLLPFLAERCRQTPDQLTIAQVSAAGVGEFLDHIEAVRHCSAATRNQRLAAIRALAVFVARHCPEQIAWCGELRRIPFKKTIQAGVPYLEKPEMDALLKAPDRDTQQGRRDYALLLFLYNSGARASEAASVTIADLDLIQAAVRLFGKGRKVRYCPLWATTVQTLTPLVTNRPPGQALFLNRCGRPITRFGIHTLVERYARQATAEAPSLASKRVSPHTIRHSTAVFLLRSGVDINTIRAWLGHASITTTNVYAEYDLDMKAKALAKCELTGKVSDGNGWASDGVLMEFLRSL
jgi:integrase/recombinase XerD